MSRFDPGYTSSYYDDYGARESIRWETGPRARMQLEVFKHHLSRWVRPGDRVLDAGCGPGTFARPLLDIGARVTCLDISPVQLEACRTHARGCEAYELGSVTDLGRFTDGAFDGTLALGGALSYCFDQAPHALGELVRVTRPGGTVAVSVMNLFGTVHRFFADVIDTPTELNRQIMATGDLLRTFNRGHECHMFRVEEMRALLEGAGLQDIELHANGWLVPDDEAEVPGPGTEGWRLVLEMELEAGRESPGAGTHIIARGRCPS